MTRVAAIGQHRYELQTQCEQIAAKLLVVEAEGAGAPQLYPSIYYTKCGYVYFDHMC